MITTIILSAIIFGAMVLVIAKQIKKVKNGESGCGCGCEDHEHESFVVDLEDENGNIVSCEVVDAFEYKEQEYVLVQNPEDGSVYLFKSLGEEGELVIPEEAEFDEVTKYYQEELAD